MRKYNLKRFGMIILALFLLFFVNISTVYAAIVPDLSKKGSITICMLDSASGNAVSGGTMTLFQAGSVHENDGNFSFELTDEFAGSKESLETLNADLALRLASCAREQKIGGTVAAIDDNGKAEFANVKPGLYLVVQEQAAEGYYCVSPFLVSIPQQENGYYFYDVNATPKVELLNRKPETPVPSSPDAPAGNTPRTGDNSNPIVWMAVLGISAFGFAGILIVGMKRRI